MTSRGISIILAEDHHLVRQGIRLLLEKEGCFRLLAEAADGLQAVQLAEKLRPDVLLLDLMIPRLHGLEALRQARRDSPETRVIILSMHADAPYVQEAMRIGAVGYVLKDSTGEELAQAIHAAMQGKRFFSRGLDPEMVAGLLEARDAPRPDDPYMTLTNRERLVLQMAAEGLTSAEIAGRLFISPRTAETHRSNFMRKLALRSQTDLVRFAIRKGIMTA